MDITAIRNETPALTKHFPGCSRPLVHFNNAGASLMPTPVEAAIHSYTALENANGSYEAARDSSSQLSRVYDDVGRLLNCEDAQFEVALAESATAAWCSFFYSIPFKMGDVILTVRSDYAANHVAMLQVSKRLGGIKIITVPDDESGQTSVSALSQILEQDASSSSFRIRVFCLTHIPTNCGLVNPIGALGQAIHSHNQKYSEQNKQRVLFLVDGCQTAGQIPIDVQRDHIDALSFASRKYLRGPRGCGVLYVGEELLNSDTLLGEPPTIDHFAAPWHKSLDSYQLRRDCRRFEKWESSPCLRLAMGAAIRYALDRVGIDAIWDRVQRISNYLRQQLSAQLGDAVLLCDVGAVKCGIVSFRLRSVPDCVSVQKRLRTLGVNVTVSTAPVTRMLMDPRGHDAYVRASVHYFNNEEEVDFVVGLLKQMVLRSRL